MLLSNPVSAGERETVMFSMCSDVCRTRGTRLRGDEGPGSGRPTVRGTAPQHHRRSRVLLIGTLSAVLGIPTLAHARQFERVVIATQAPAVQTAPPQTSAPQTPPPQTPPPTSPPQTSSPQAPPPQTPPPQPPPSSGGSTGTAATPDGQKPDAKKGTDDHIFGVLPNYTSVGRGQQAPPLTTTATFEMASEGAFDKLVYPFTAFTAGVAQLQGQEPEWGFGWGAYGKRYAMGFADNTLASFMTTAVAPTLLRQDPRYFVLGEGGVWHRTGYALSRTFVTRSRSGHAQFNFSDIVGNGVAAEIMNAYHPVEDRKLSATMNRWGLQVLYDTFTDVLKEFWPDIHHHFHKS